MEGLGAAEHGSQGLERGADDVVLGLLGGQADAGGLGMEAQHDRAGVLGVETVPA